MCIHFSAKSLDFVQSLGRVPGLYELDHINTVASLYTPLRSASKGAVALRLNVVLLRVV